MTELDDSNRQVVEAAYDGTPETVFVIRLGWEAANLLATPGGQSLAEPLVLRLTDPSLPEWLPVVRKDRFRVLQKLLLLSFVRHAELLPGPGPGPETRH